MLEGKPAVPLLGQTRGENDRKRRNEDDFDQQGCEQPHDERPERDQTSMRISPRQGILEDRERLVELLEWDGQRRAKRYDIPPPTLKLSPHLRQ